MAKGRLHLETSPEKSKITNLCKYYSEFLGFKLKLEERPKQKVIVSHMSDKAKKKVTAKLRKAIWDAQGNEDKARILNMTIRGLHNYYCVATRVSKDFWGIYYHLLPSLKHMTRSNGKMCIRDRYLPLQKKDIWSLRKNYSQELTGLKK